MDAIVEGRWREERRDRILDAAATVFARQSFHHASMDDIAHEAGVGKPTLYRYFESKDALFAAVFVKSLDELEARLAEGLHRAVDVREQLTGLVAEVVPMFRDHLVSLRLLDETAAAADRSKRRIFRERRARISAFLSAAIEAGSRRGELRAVDSDRIGQLLIGTIWSATATSQASAFEIAAEVVEFTMNGLAVRGEGRDAPGWMASGEEREPARHLSGEAA